MKVEDDSPGHRRPLSVLAVGAHPDDLEICCAGTLAKYVCRGDRVTMCTVANGDHGSFVHTRAEIKKIRLEEARAGARRVGADHVCLGVSDTEVHGADREQQRALLNVIRDVRPDVILTHSPDDYMPDHVETHRLTETASFLATLPIIETGVAPIPVVPAVYYFDNAAAMNFLPTEYVDITDTLEDKIEALAEHRSQVDWLRGHDNADILETTRVTARLRGYQCGVPAAEGFRPSLKHLRMRPERLLP